MKEDVSPIRNQMILSVAVSIILALALLVFAVFPLMASVEDTRDEIMRNKAELAQIKSEVLSLKQLQQQIFLLQEHEQAIVSMFPIREEMVSLVLGLEDSIQQAGAVHELKIVDRKEQALAPGVGRSQPETPVLVPALKRVEEVPYELVLGSDFRGLADFLMALEHQPFVSEFRKLTVSVEQTQGSAPGQQVELVNLGTVKAGIEGVFFIKLEP